MKESHETEWDTINHIYVEEEQYMWLCLWLCLELLWYLWRSGVRENQVDAIGFLSLPSHVAPS